MLSDKNIYIGYRLASCEFFDPYRRRPPQHFKQCKKCYGLNHLANECNKLALCKLCGKSTHKANRCNLKNQPHKQKCLLCKGPHSSDSLQCPVIIKTREKIGISFSKREKQIMENKQNQSINKVAIKRNTNNPRSKMNIQVIPKLLLPNKKAQSKISYAQASADNNNNILQSALKANQTITEISGQNNATRKLNYKQRKRQNNFSQNNEIKALREQVSNLTEKLNEVMQFILNFKTQSSFSNGLQILPFNQPEIQSTNQDQQMTDEVYN